MGRYLLTDTDPSIIFPSKSSPKLLLAVETATTDKRTNVSSVCQFLRLLKQSTVKELALFSSFKLSKSKPTWLASKFFSYWEKNLFWNFDDSLIALACLHLAKPFPEPHNFPPSFNILHWTSSTSTRSEWPRPS